MHKCLEAYYKDLRAGALTNLSTYTEIWDAYVAETFPEVDVYDEKVYEMTILAHAMLENYLLFSAEADAEYEIIATEQELEAAIPGTDTILVGTCDLVVRSKRTHTIWIVDHKNVGQFASPEYLELNDQITAYMWLAKQNGIPAQGVIFNELRKKKQSVPEVLKSGGLSKNKAIDTTPSMYLKKILQMGLDPLDYADILEKLETNKFVRRSKIIRSPQHVAQFERQLEVEMKDIESDTLYIYPNCDPDCLWDCPYKVLCMAQNDGGDVDFLKKSLFTVGEGRK